MKHEFLIYAILCGAIVFFVSNGIIRGIAIIGLVWCIFFEVADDYMWKNLMATLPTTARKKELPVIKEIKVDKK